MPVSALLQGGDRFVEFVKLHGVNESGDRLRWSNPLEEYLLLIGDLRVPHTWTTGAAQIFKTLGHCQLAAYVLDAGYSVLWAYDQERSLQRSVPLQFRPILESWLRSRGVVPSGSQNNYLYQVGTANFIATYVSTSRATAQKTGQAAAGSSVVSVSVSLVIEEERSQWPPGAGDPLERRLDAGRIPTYPIRELGTPGAGNGIEASMAHCDREFYPHYKCGSCGAIAPLHPLGCLLRSHTATDGLGREYETFFSNTGRPLHWHHDDANDPVRSARYGCSRCGVAIADEQRKEAWFQCLKTGERLRDWLAEYEQGDGNAAIHLSPLLRITKHNNAAKIVKTGLETANIEDWQQQVLGIPSQGITTGVSIAAVREAIAAEKALGKPQVIVAGVDQGRGEDWMVVMEIYPAPGSETLSKEEQYEKAIRVVKFGGDVARSQIGSLLEKYNVESGLIDNEPSRETAMQLCKETVLEMADQISGAREIYKKSKVRDGGRIEACWQIRTEKFAQAIANGFSIPGWDEKGNCYRLPSEWESWLNNLNERSPVRHLCAPKLDPAKGWVRPTDNVDDLFFALLFAEAAYYIWLNGKLHWVPIYGKK